MNGEEARCRRLRRRPRRRPGRRRPPSPHPGLQPPPARRRQGLKRPAAPSPATLAAAPNRPRLHRNPSSLPQHPASLCYWKTSAPDSLPPFLSAIANLLATAPLLLQKQGATRLANQSAMQHGLADSCLPPPTHRLALLRVLAAPASRTAASGIHAGPLRTLLQTALSTPASCPAALTDPTATSTQRRCVLPARHSTEIMGPPVPSAHPSNLNYSCHLI